MASIRKRGNSYLLVVSMGYDPEGHRHKPQQCTWFSEPEQGFLQFFGGVLLQLHLGMAVSPLQE